MFILNRIDDEYMYNRIGLFPIEDNYIQQANIIDNYVNINEETEMIVKDESI